MSALIKERSETRAIQPCYGKSSRTRPCHELNVQPSSLELTVDVPPPDLGRRPRQMRSTPQTGRAVSHNVTKPSSPFQQDLATISHSYVHFRLSRADVSLSSSSHIGVALVRSLAQSLLALYQLKSHNIDEAKELCSKLETMGVDSEEALKYLRVVMTDLGRGQSSINSVSTRQS